ncbi:MAG: DUF4968 domain-containing protein, partial [Microcoleus sp. SIO2G3]|nr:DUF4968 domain-containing protein [Microcoleus sp. SIO2G3]
SHPTLEAVEETGNVLRAEPTKTGAYFYFKHMELEICFLAADLVRVDWKGGTLPIPYGISRKDWLEVETTFQEIGNSWVVSTTELKVIVNVDGSLEFQNPLGLR